MPDVPPPSEMDRTINYEYPSSRGTTVERTTTVTTDTYSWYIDVDVPADEWPDYVSAPSRGVHTQTESVTRDVTIYESRCPFGEGATPRGACRESGCDGVRWASDGETMCDTCYAVDGAREPPQTATRQLTAFREVYERDDPPEYDNGRPRLHGGHWSAREATEVFEGG